jgi:tRNA A37 threonylcarbamoyladenosine biosynthesis protein TsaE
MNQAYQEREKSLTTMESSKTIFDFATKVVPTQDQSIAMSQLQDFLVQDQTQVFILNGYAGTGKTTISESLCHYISYKQIPYKVMAPTGRAAKTFSKKTLIPCSTIHRGIYDVDFDTQNLEVNYSLQPEFKDGTVLIIDESSMLTANTKRIPKYGEDDSDVLQIVRGVYLLNDIFDVMNLSKNKNSKIVFVGDEAQLLLTEKPYSLDVSFFTYFGYKSQKTTLREVKRNDNEILDLATRYRELIINGVQNTKLFPSSKTDLEIISNGAMLTHYSQNYPRPKDSIDAAIVCMSNQKVFYTNQAIRSFYFGDRAVEIDDRIMSYSNNYSEVNPHMNGDIFTVVEVLERNYKKSLTINTLSEGETNYIRQALTENKLPSYIEVVKSDVIKVHMSLTMLKVKNEEGILFDTYICDHYIDTFETKRNPLLIRANTIYAKMRYDDLAVPKKPFEDWVKYDKIYNAMPAKFGYAMTGHKAQGGEWDTIYTSMSGKASDFYNRYMYTACSRAVKKLVIER